MTADLALGLRRQHARPLMSTSDARDDLGQACEIYAVRDTGPESVFKAHEQVQL